MCAPEDLRLSTGVTNLHRIMIREMFTGIRFMQREVEVQHLNQHELRGELYRDIPVSRSMLASLLVL